MSNSVPRSALGRVNANKLYAFNTNLKKKALEKPKFWEECKDIHPLNRWWYNRWKKEKVETYLFEEKFKNLPVDNQYYLSRATKNTNLMRYAPMLLATYILFCFLRYYIFGISAQDNNLNFFRSMERLPRFENL